MLNLETYFSKQTHWINSTCNSDHWRRVNFLCQMHLALTSIFMLDVVFGVVSFSKPFLIVNNF
jgi:hypothetical protein